MSDINLKLKPFGTPNFVAVELPPRARQEGLQQGLTFRLDELDAHVLSKMCDDFRAEVFEKAGKPDPKVDPRA